MGKTYSITYTPTFAKNYKKLPLSVRSKAEKKELIFRQDPFTPNLKTHKLSGTLKKYWSFSIDYQYRIVFRFTKKGEILFADVGTHSVYR